MGKSIIQKDYFRHTGKWVKYPIVRIIFNTDFRHTYFFRKSSGGNKIFKCLYTWYYNYFSGILKHQIPPKTQIGEGLYMVHAYGVHIHPQSIIGKNCNIAHGVIVGTDKNHPKIGNEVWIGALSVIEGNITIGNNVLIAPKSYINFDIPDNSVVIGNPATILKNKNNATLHYINNKV